MLKCLVFWGVWSFETFGILATAFECSCKIENGKMENLKKEKWTDCVALLFLFFISGISQFIDSFAETCVFLN